MLHHKYLFMFVGFLLLLFISIPALAQPIPHLWSQRFGDGGTQLGQSVAVDASGDVIVVGEFDGTADFGGGPLTSAGDVDIFIAKYNASGTHLWSQRFGNTDGQYARSVAVDGSGNVIVTGYFRGTVDFGGGMLTSVGDDDIFVAKFNASGTHLWSQSFGDVNDQHAQSVAVDSSGDVVVTGYFSGTVNFGGEALTSVGIYNMWVAKFDLNGTHLWSQRFGDSLEQYGYSVAIDGSKNIVLTGFFSGTVNFGGGTLKCAGGYDIFLAKFDASGTHLWSRRFGDSGYQYGYIATVDGLGNVIITGEFKDTVDFGGGLLASAGSYDIYVTKFNPSGTHLWSKCFGDGNGQYGGSITVDSWGNILATGRFDDTVDFGGGTLTSEGDADIYVVKFDPSGTHLWSRRFGDINDQHARSIAVDGSGNVIVTGYFRGTVNFGEGALTSAGDYDIFIAKFGPSPVSTLLQSFSATYKASGIEIEWQLSEAGAGMEFSVLRSEVNRAEYRELENPKITMNGLAFHFIDDTCQPGLIYRYRVDVIDEDGRRTLFETEPIGIPTLSLNLGRNYPNPFNPNTHIPFVIDRDNHVSLAIYDLSGKLVRMLIDRPMRFGSYSEEWDGRDANGNSVASGVYFYQLRAGKDILTRKAVLLK